MNAGTRLAPLRRLIGQTLSAAGAASGGTLLLYLAAAPKYALSRRTTRRQTTDVLSRGVGRGEATSVLMGSLGAPTVEGPMGRGLIPAPTRGGSAGSPGGGGLLSPTDGARRDSGPSRGSRYGDHGCPRGRGVRRRGGGRGDGEGWTGRGNGDRGIVGWRGPCPVHSFLFLFFVLAGRCVRFLFPFVSRILGGRRLGIPCYDCASWSEVGKG